VQSALGRPVPDIQQKTMPLLAQLLRQHRTTAAEGEIAQELCDE
jgi:hypothetical protein